MTSRHLCTRLEEHRKESAPVAQHLKSRGVSDFGAKIIDSCFNVVKLATLESLYIEKQTLYQHPGGVQATPAVHQADPIIFKS